jgi:hypothetical protein
MEKMKTKLIERITSVYNQIKTSEQEIQKDLKTENVDRVNKLQIGSKGLKLQELNLEFFNTLDIFLNVADGCLCDLSTEINDYYNLLTELKKPVSDVDSDEIRKIKEMINSYKTGS